MWEYLNVKYANEEWSKSNSGYQLMSNTVKSVND